MTGPEHYREAENLAKRADDYIYGDYSGDPHGVAQGQAMLAEAQVHATLALASVMAAALTDSAQPSGDGATSLRGDWLRVGAW